jgi:hypothetical protein
MGVGGQRHAPAALLPPGKGPPIPIVQEAGWAPEPVWTQRLEEKSFTPAGDRTPIARSSSPLSDIILTELTRPQRSKLQNVILHRVVRTSTFRTIAAFKGIVLLNVIHPLKTCKHLKNSWSHIELWKCWIHLKSSPFWKREATALKAMSLR